MSVQVGIILPHLGPSQLAHEVITKINETRGPYTLYFEDVCPTYTRIHSALMNLSESKFFTGRLIATSPLSANYILSSLKHIEACFFINDIFWYRGLNNYIQNVNLLRNPKLKLYTRCEQYADIIEKYCGVKPTVCKITDLMEISNV